MATGGLDASPEMVSRVAARRGVNATPPAPGPAYLHLLADLSGVPVAQLRDPTLLSGLLIAAAGAAGLLSGGVPVIRVLPDGGLTGILLLADCHMIVHALPSRGVLMLDVLAPPTHDPRKALDVFVRRLGAADVRTEQRARG